MVKEFVEGWDVMQVLGEGAYGEVVLIVNQKTKEAVAAKVLEVAKAGDSVGNIRKEICIHRMLSHERIIKFYGTRQETNIIFIFLQYASGGELFDRIDPDFGMPQAQAQKYFIQIISGVEYLHSVGIAHRDLKPENVLLDDQDNVKISDFGLATLFRHQGKERKLTKRCGTLPYVAPEVFSSEYRAEPADIWSCGIILVAMLAGELPWDKPVSECKEYTNWKECKFSFPPWPKIDNLALALLRKVLSHSAATRYTISQIKSHLWVTKAHKFKSAAKWKSEHIDYKRLCSNVDQTKSSINKVAVMKPSCSQPDPIIIEKNNDVVVDSDSLDVLTKGICFSQPAHPEHMILNSQSSAPSNSQPSKEKLFVRRMTRFLVRLDPEETVKELRLVLEKLGYSWKRNGPGQVMVTTVDRRNMQLVFKATLVEMRHNILLDFRLSRGDGLEFKRHFLVIRESMSNLIVTGSSFWPYTTNKLTSKP